jgi:Tfp pilus assembly protein FimT
MTHYARDQERALKEAVAVDWQYQHAGFTMVEASLVILIMSIVSGFVLLSYNGMMPGINANAAMNQTMAQLQTGRELAIAQRREFQVAFVGDNQIQLTRVEEPAGAGTTVLSAVTLDNNVQFHQFDGIPDTPDSLGAGAAISFGGLDTLTFLSDGTLVDAQGNPLSGTVFLGLADHPETARAVTVLGATGRVRSYRWTGTSWIH